MVFNESTLARKLSFRNDIYSAAHSLDVDLVVVHCDEIASVLSELFVEVGLVRLGEWS